MTIAPSDAAVAARSFPRRWRALFARAAGDDDNPDLLQRSGALELAGEAATLLAGATATIPRFTAAAVQQGRGGDPLESLEAQALALAEAIEAVPAEKWAPDDILALEVVQRVAALLRQAEQQIEEARQRR